MMALYFSHGVLQSICIREMMRMEPESTIHGDSIATLGGLRLNLCHKSLADLLEDLGIVELLILNWILDGEGVLMWVGLSGSGLESVMGFCVHSNEPSGFMKMGNFLVS
jgi:hypothetical protein